MTAYAIGREPLRVLPPDATRVTCILNAAAGSGEMPATREQLGRLFAVFGTALRIVIVHSADEITFHARQAIGSGRLVVAGGGDGTVSAVASVLAGTGAVLGVLPLGTCNHFAKDLGIPLDLAGAVSTILNGRVRTVDMGEVNGQLFLNNSSLGVYPQLVRGRIAEQHRGHRKWIALAMAAAAALRHPSPVLVHLQSGSPPPDRLLSDGAQALARRTPLLFVGNNRYSLAGPQAGRRARLDAGQLWVCTTHEAGNCRLLGLAVRALAGHLRTHDLEMQDTAEFWVETQRRRIEVAWDGEVTTMASPLHYRIRPAALRVMAPS